MGLLDIVTRPFRGRAWVGTDALNGVDWSHPPITVQSTAIERVAEATKRAEVQRATVQESMNLTGAFALDADDGLYRRLTDGGKLHRRDLSAIQQDRMLEVTWFLWEQNPFARRLITLMTDLIVGDGVQVTSDNPDIQTQISAVWTHPSNLLGNRIRDFSNFLSLAGELILPIAVNPVTGRPTMGFIDPYQVKAIHPADNNVLLPDEVELKPPAGAGEGKRYRIIRVNPVTDRLEGDCFFFKINSLPNSLRGRSDLLPLADWLDLYDQYMFAEVERLQLLSSFLWDYSVEGADEAMIAAKLAKFPVPKPGAVFGHNQKETLEARTPNLQASDRSEVARMLRVHCAGNMGFPVTYFGDTDSNRATIEGQNDVMMKTPAARQKELAFFLGQIAEFTIQSTTAKNPALFMRGGKSSFKIAMPEIQAKDLARAGSTLVSVAQAADTMMANGTLGRKHAIQLTTAMAGHLGVKLDPADVEAAADVERKEREDKADDIQAGMAAAAAANRRNPNPPARADADDADAAA
jgi:hypothetical protein